jgi:methionyl-tRNA synthetase
MLTSEKYLITSALPYANGPLHIGHLAGAYLNADIFARYLRLMGKEVVFVCGSDEHGAAITMKARKEGKSPKEIVDFYHKQFQDTFQKMGISFDEYYRTSDVLHHQVSSDFFKKLYDQKNFTEKTSLQYFDEVEEQFLADRYIMGECPKCSFKEAYGDQCESCGSTLSPTELIHPKSTISGATPVLKETVHWYLPLDENSDWLKEYIELGQLDGISHHDPSDWKAHVLGQCKSWIEGGLQPRAMTRDLDWGVDVPKEIPGSQGKKLYVWLDAPIGYISATQYWAQKSSKHWEDFWKGKDASIVHFIGKDNIVFHCLIFPTLLKLHGEFNLPVNVPANQFMNLEGRKISTSRGWAIWVHEYLEEFPGKEDVLRYAMIKNMPENRDSEFTWKGFQEYNNNELVNNLANFVNRVVVLVNKYYDGVVPEFDEDCSFVSNKGEDGMPGFHDSELLDIFDQCSNLCSHLGRYEFREGLKSVMELSSMGNQILQFNEPWSLIKEDPEAVKAVLNLCIQYLAVLSVGMYPFLPFTSNKLRDLLNLEPLQGKGELMETMDALAEGFHLIKAGHKISKPNHLFERIDDETIRLQIEKLMGTQAPIQDSVEQTASVISKKPISFDDFSKLDLRVGQILAAEKVPKADKLLKLTVDMGFETRTVVSGISTYFSPEEVLGKKVVVLNNLEPRKIRGIESKGMILMAEDQEKGLLFVEPDPLCSNGSTIS